MFDNIFVERLWRMVKYEDIYLKDYEGVLTLASGLGCYFNFYNRERLHNRCTTGPRRASILGMGGRNEKSDIAAEDKGAHGMDSGR